MCMYLSKRANIERMTNYFSWEDFIIQLGTYLCILLSSKYTYTGQPKNKFVIPEVTRWSKFFFRETKIQIVKF